MSASKIDFYFAPHSRAFGVLALFEELGVEYTLHVLDLKAGTNRQADYLAINPMGKVPAIVDDGVLITEQPAVYQYLAERYPETGLAPPVGDRLRGPFLRWLAFYGASFEPAVIDRAMKLPPAPAAALPYGDYDTMLATLVGQLEHGPWLLGDTFTATDLLWGTALGWTTGFKVVPALPVIMAYVERVHLRPSVQRARTKEAELVAALATA